MAETEWTDTPEKEAWRALVPACANAISDYCTPGERVGKLAEILAVQVLNVAFQHRETLAPAHPARPEGGEEVGRR